MFLIMTKYLKPLAQVDEVLAAHRSFLEAGYQQGFFVVSGPKNPRTGGVILSQLTDKAKLEAILKSDPFYEKGISEFEIHEFEPVKFHQDFASFVQTAN
jgi:uncharacterized protein YciI